MLAFNDVPRADRVIVALDCDRAEALSLAKQLQGHAKWMKRSEERRVGKECRL